MTFNGSGQSCKKKRWVDLQNNCLLNSTVLYVLMHITVSDFHFDKKGFIKALMSFSNNIAVILSDSDFANGEWVRHPKLHHFTPELLHGLPTLVVLEQCAQTDECPHSAC